MLRRKTTNLVKIENSRYTFYKDKTKVIKVASAEPMDAENVEFYRNHPEFLVLELMSDGPEVA